MILLLLLLQAFSSVSIANPDANHAEQKLDLAFLFHANQANVPYGDVANDLCYYAVLETMVDHPNLHFPLHISGTLLTDLVWFNTSTLDLLKQGIDSGQFEMIGSTYAQNIMYSHQDDWDNQIQIEKHRQVLKEILNVEPVGFWNPERCWNQERYVELISEGDYTYTFVEDHIINEGQPFTNAYDEYILRNTSTASESLLIVNDDKTIINLIDNIAFTTEAPTSPAVITAVDSLISYLYLVYQNDSNDDFLVFYGQDMEAWGLWQEEASSDNLQNVLQRLDYLFTRFEEESDWLNICTPSEFLSDLPSDYEFAYIPSLPDGSAVWMHGPSVDAGYNDWFDFSENDSRLNDYRIQFESARSKLQSTEAYIKWIYDFWYPQKPEKYEARFVAANKLLSYAKFVFAANQYEFGCIGCFFPWFYRIKTAMITAEAAYYAMTANSSTQVLSKDLDNDDNLEFIMYNNRSMFVFTGLGGRLINWYDLSNGEVLLANDIPNTYATWTVNGLNYDSGTYLSSPIELVTGTDLWGRTSNTYLLRPKAFYDSWSDNEAEWFWQARNRTVISGEHFIQFYFEYSDRLISKVFRLLDNSNQLVITYSINNKETYSIDPRIGISLSPGNEEILFSGKQFLKEEIIQNATHNSLHVSNSKALVEISLVVENSLKIKTENNDPMFALGYSIEFPTISPNSESTYSFLMGSKKLDEVDISQHTTTSSFQTTTTVTTTDTNIAFPGLMFVPVFLTMLIILRRKKNDFG
jgi:hypothetical protein